LGVGGQNRQDSLTLLRFGTGLRYHVGLRDS